MDRRSMMRAKKYDVAHKSKIRPWSDLTDDLLSLVMMKLEVFDFIALSGVCKSWRSLAVSNRNMFMVSRPPMSVSIPKYDKKECYLENFEGRKFKTVLPHSDWSKYYGVTCGYLILMGVDIWLVNLITRHELRFPNPPFPITTLYRYTAILVFSPPISEWVLVVLDLWDYKIWFCKAGKEEWTKVSHSLKIRDLTALKGKIYTLHSEYSSPETLICELRLYPKPKLVLLENKNFPKQFIGIPRFVNCGENLYVINWWLDHPNKILELDFGEMKWVASEKTGNKYAFFRKQCPFDGYSYTLREVWVDIHSQYRRYVVNNEERKSVLFHAEMWYFFDDCLNVNLIHE